MRFDIEHNIKTAAEYFLMFLVSIIYWELMLRIQMVEPEGAAFPAFLFFIPAEALFFALFCGFFKKKGINRAVALTELFLAGMYYIAQLLYYRQFGSAFSVSFIKMGGEAVTSFWWSFKPTLIHSIGLIILMLLPLAGAGFFLFFKGKRGENLAISVRGLLLLLTVALWFAAIGGIRIMGKEKPSPYYVFTNAHSDTDTSMEKLGMLTTTVVETGAYVFGINSSTEEVYFTPVVTEVPENTKKPDQSASECPPMDEGPTPGEPFVQPEEEVIQKPAEHINEGIDFEYLRSLTEDKDMQSLCDYFASKPAAKENEYTGLFEGCNLIYICAESFTTYGMNEKVTPTLWKMANNGIVLNNYYTSFKNTTTNGEFAFSVSLWPDVSRKAANGNGVGSFACSAVNYMPYGLGNIFNALEVPTYAYHGNVSTYYRRCDSWPNLGYRNMKFNKEGLSFKNRWSFGDTELLEQTVGDYVDKERFFTYYMTYSGHGSYTTATYMYIKNNKEVRRLLGESDYSDSEISYYCGHYELDKAMEYLLERLEENSCLENTVIVLAGDHIPYDLSVDEMEDMSKKAGLSFDKNFEKYHSTCIIFKAGMTEPIVSDEYCCNVDVLPTVLNLLGIDYDSRLIAGIDVFDSGLHRARLYNGNLLTGYMNYNASTGKAAWKGEAKDWTEAQKKEYLDSLTAYSDSEYGVSLKLMEKDFYRFVWNNLR